MERKSVSCLIILGLCVVALLAAPVAALQGAQKVPGYQNAAEIQNIPQPVKDDLWAVHEKYRLQQYDLNINKATDLIGVLDKYQYDTSKLKEIKARIVSERSALESAVNSKDNKALVNVDKELIDFWKQFGKEVKTQLKI
jgi:hypothetical protein